MPEILEKISEKPTIQVCQFVALSRFTVANGMEAEVRQAFADRPHLVDGTPGFVRMEVLAPLDDPREIWLLTYWRDEASFPGLAPWPSPQGGSQRDPQGIEAHARPDGDPPLRARLFLRRVWRFWISASR